MNKFFKKNKIESRSKTSRSLTTFVASFVGMDSEKMTLTCRIPSKKSDKSNLYSASNSRLKKNDKSNRRIKLHSEKGKISNKGKDKNLELNIGIILLRDR